MNFLIKAALSGASLLVLPTSALALTTPIALDFEGLGVRQNAAQYGVPVETVIEQVGDYYNGGTGGDGSGGGTDYGVTFSNNALAIVDADATGLPQAAANFGGEPSPSTVLFFLQGSAATINYAPGFTDGFSFYYSAIRFAGSIDVYSGLNSTGTKLATLSLPTTQFNGAPDPTGEFSPFVPIGVSFTGTAKSIDFGGTINQIGFDNITFGASTPLDTIPPDPTAPVVDPDPTTVVPLPAAFPFLLTGMLVLAGTARRRNQQVQA